MMLSALYGNVSAVVEAEREVRQRGVGEGSPPPTEESLVIRGRWSETNRGATLSTNFSRI
jgi:hypothetical protein